MSTVAPAPSILYDIYDYFHFIPAKGIMYLALALFALATLLCLASTIYTRRWYMLIAVGVGIAEIIGYSFRLAMVHKPQYGIYVGMQCLLIIPPSFLALVEYITLGKVVKLAQESNPNISTFLKPKLIQWCYFVAEIGSLSLQGAGAGLSVSQKGVNDTAATGKTLLLVGLAFLVAIIICFLLNALFVSVKKEYGVWQNRHLTRLFIVLYTSTALLLIRNVFRLVEFASGFYGDIAVKEKYFYGFDGLMVVLIMFIFSFAHFGFFLNSYEREQESKVHTSNVQMV